MRSIKLASAHEESIEEVSSLVINSFREEQKHVPILRSCFERDVMYLPRLRKLVKEVPSVAAYQDGHLVGFLTGFVIQSWRGKKSVYCPEWTHATVKKNRKEVYQLMYAELSKNWVANRCNTHLITFFAHDVKIIETFSWFVFGMADVDAIRDLSPLKGINSDVEIKKATIDDLELVTSLSHQLHQYMAGAPIFLVSTEESKNNLKILLLDTSKALWIAFKDGRAVSYMTVGPANPDAAYVIQNKGIASIHGAFTEEKFRDQGIGKALLNKSIEWASSMGYEICAVDFEPENIDGSRFWKKHFKPICYTLVRNVN
jgi:GNAT superfamily N-acetyltransferase